MPHTCRPLDGDLPQQSEDRCLDEMAVARTVDGGGTPAELAHAAQCAHCRRQLAAVATATAATGVASEIARLGPSRQPAWRRGALAVGGLAAAAAVILALFTPAIPGGTAEGDRYRDADTPAPAVPALLAPNDVVAAQPVELRWRRTAEATQYRVTVFDVEGSIVWEQETADTAAVIPAAVSLADGVTYWWRIEARVGFDRWTRSEVTPFTVGRPADRPERAQPKER